MASIIAQNVSVEFPVYHGAQRSLKKVAVAAAVGGRLASNANRVVLRALSDITLNLDHGDRVALIGPNGAGKTTLLRVLAGVYEPVSGRIDINGRVSPLFDIGLGLNPDASGYENIILRGLYLGIPPKEMRERADEIADFTELGDLLNMPVRTYSSGMTLRLAFGVATCVEPEILLMDEWLMVGDAHFLDKARQRMESFVTRSSVLVLASHNLSLLREWCDKAVYVEHGQMLAAGPIEEVLAAYEAAQVAQAA